MDSGPGNEKGLAGCLRKAKSPKHILQGHVSLGDPIGQTLSFHMTQQFQLLGMCP